MSALKLAMEKKYFQTSIHLFYIKNKAKLEAIGCIHTRLGVTPSDCILIVLWGSCTLSITDPLCDTEYCVTHLLNLFMCYYTQDVIRNCSIAAVGCCG